MEPIVVGGLAVIAFAVWDSIQNWKLLRKNGESATVGRSDALKIQQKTR